MPKRTNAFQTLVLLLHQQLGAGATIRESHPLKNRLDDTEAEVDVVIEDTAGGYPVIISIECIDRSRPATREWVNEMWGKHQLLPTNKLVLISRAGFSKTASRLADGLDITTYSLADASTMDWTKIVNKLQTIITETLQSAFHAFPILKVPNETVSNMLMLREQLLFDEQGSPATTVGQVLDVVITPETGRIFMDHMRDMKIESNVFTAVYSLPKPVRIVEPNGAERNCDQLFVVDSEGVRHALDGLRIVFDVQKSRTTIPLKQGILKDTPVAYGEATGDVGTLRIAIVEQEHGTKILATQHKPGKNQPQPLIMVDESSGRYASTEYERTIGPGSAEGSLAVYAPPGTKWNATTDVSWITLQGGSGVGAGTVRVCVAANQSTNERVGHVTLGTTTCNITQRGQETGGDAQ